MSNTSNTSPTSQRALHDDAPAGSTVRPVDGQHSGPTGARCEVGARRSVDDAVEAVSRVSEPGDDVGVLVEALVDGGRDDLHLTAAADRLLDGAQPLGGDEQADRGDVPGAAVEEVLDR